MSRPDVIVAGAGPAGLVAAVAFARLGWHVLCVDPSPVATDRDKTTSADLRSTALLQPARRFLADIGLWPAIDEAASPLRVMRIIDAGGDDPQPRLIRDFQSSELGDQPFGWNIPNWRLRAALAQTAAAEPNIDLRFGAAVADVLGRTSEARVTLADGSRHTCRLLIAADGRESPVRHAMGIHARTIRYGQKALAFTVTHAEPHDNVSTEIHRSGGPFTLVPLPDLDGKPCSAVIWMERAATAAALMALPKVEFEAAATERSCGLYGPLRLASGRSSWPIISRIAEHLTAERTALVAEAAHVVPPIGAQGLNMSLTDIRTLHDLAAQNPAALGEPQMLVAYQRSRWPRIAARVAGIDALNRTSMTEAAILRDVRMQGLKALHGLTPVRRALMRAGIGGG